MAVLGLGKDFGASRSILIDSGCTKTVFRNKDKLINLRHPEHDYVTHRVGGKLPVTLVGDFPGSTQTSEWISPCAAHHRAPSRPRCVCQLACYRGPPRRRHWSAYPR